MRVSVSKGNRNDASIRIPSSKSLSHRALITAALAEGTSVIHDLARNDDTEATMRCMETLGAVFENRGSDIIVHGAGGRLRYSGMTADCGESGSTLRFLIPVFGLLEEEVTLRGHGRLMERPLSVYEKIFSQQSLLFERTGDTLRLRGPVPAGKYTVRGDVSSQFISGLLFALPLAEGDSVIEILPPYESASYVGLTADALNRAGVVVYEEGLQIRIPGNQTYQPFECTVEGDASQAAFFAALSMITGKRVDLLNMDPKTRQGDRVFAEIIRNMGGIIEENGNGFTCIHADLHACTVDLSDCPDLGPVLFALASQAEGTTVFTHAERLRMKESDRIAAMEEELRKLGCTITSDEANVYVTGKTGIHGAAVNGHNDHRVVMALSILAAACEEETVIEGAEAVNKSYPEFFADLEKTGVRVVYDH